MKASSTISFQNFINTFRQQWDIYVSHFVLTILSFRTGWNLALALRSASKDGWVVAKWAQQYRPVDRSYCRDGQMGRALNG